jgi:hypothetical protein
MRKTIDNSGKLRMNDVVIKDKEAKVEICAEY